VIYRALTTPRVRWNGRNYMGTQNKAIANTHSYCGGWFVVGRPRGRMPTPCARTQGRWQAEVTRKAGL
jgi:hypothetical protein